LHQGSPYLLHHASKKIWENRLVAWLLKFLDVNICHCVIILPSGRELYERAPRASSIVSSLKRRLISIFNFLFVSNYQNSLLCPPSFPALLRLLPQVTINREQKKKKNENHTPPVSSNLWFKRFDNFSLSI
jgi:hypothetical protein